MEQVPEGNLNEFLVVPFFYLRPGQHTFCTKSGCPCLKNEAEMRQVLQAVIDTRLRMLEVKNGAITWRRIHGS